MAAHAAPHNSEPAHEPAATVDEATLDKLARAALAAKQHSYCPYSRFRVGAAVLTGDGTIFGGCNVENASYSISVCAERVAFNKAVSEGYRDFVAIAVASDLESAVKPCGACIQTIREFMRDGPIVLVDYTGAATRFAYHDVVPPNGFTPLDLSAPPHPAADLHNVALVLTKRPL